MDKKKLSETRIPHAEKLGGGSAKGKLLTQRKVELKDISHGMSLHDGFEVSQECPTEENGCRQ